MKNTFVKIVISLIFLIIFNLIFFLGGGLEHSASNWTSYGFVTFAYLCLLATPLLAKGSTSAILEGSLWLRAAKYFLAELVVGTILMLIDPESVMWPVVIQTIMLGYFLVLQLMSVLANDATTESLNKQREESFARQILIDQLQMSARDVKDQMVKPAVNRCLDALQNQPIETFPEAAEADFAVSTAVESLCNAIATGDSAQIKTVADALMRALQQRNIVIKRCRMK